VISIVYRDHLLDLAEDTYEISANPRPTCPLVTVLVGTYNHAKYIEKCLLGIREQRVGFSLECIVADDCSSDGTTQIIQNFVRESPRIFFHIRRTVRLGQFTGNGRYNFLHALTMAKGKYFALCDGDDYWCDPLKLARQVEFLELNPSACGVFHKSRVYNEVTSDYGQEFAPPKLQSLFTLTDSLEHGNFVPTCSLLLRDFRKDLFQYFPFIKINDFVIQLIAMAKKPMGYIDRAMSVYRQHPTGVHTSSSEIWRIGYLVNSLTYFLDCFPIGERASNISRVRISKLHYFLSQSYFRRFDFHRAREHYFTATRYDADLINDLSYRRMIAKPLEWGLIQSLRYIKAYGSKRYIKLLLGIIGGNFSTDV
jgi:glycosyltransferase involved in cell wall biosynthesis